MKEMSIAALSFFFGWIAGKFLDISFEKIKEHINQRVHREKATRHAKESYDDILTLASGIPFFSAENVEVCINSNQNLFFSFPEDLRDALPKSAGDFSKQDVLFKNLTISGYSETQVGHAIESARRDIAQMFIDRKDGLYFNGKKYGVAYADGFSRTADNAEDPKLLLKLFNTDHYTHRVIAKAIGNLMIEGKSIGINELNSEMNWIRASIGLSVIVVLKSTNQIIMTHRTKNSSYSEGKSWIYVSATETFTETDYDTYTHTADPVLCLQRGILEELGITKNMCDESSIKFYDMFFETHFLQDGLVASVELKENITFDRILELVAKDEMLEVDSLFLLDNNKKAINQFIESHRDEMRSQTLYALGCHAARL